MAYKHILVTVDLSAESKFLVDKAIYVARPYNAKVSLIHVDVKYSDLYTGLIDINFCDMEQRITKESHYALIELAKKTNYKIEKELSSRGNLKDILINTIKEYKVDLIVCGHHQDFWSKLISSAWQLINTIHIDMLIVPLKKNID